MKIAGLLIGVLLFARVAFAQTVPGFTVETYASVSDPVKLSFAPNGDLYVGRDLSGSGGTNADPARIHRVLAGGSVVEEFGTSIDDPDAVLFDAIGLIAPSANSVLVGAQLSAFEGAIYSIASGGSVTTVFGPTLVFLNPTDMLFDGTSRMVFTDHNNQDVKVTTGGTPTTLFSISSRTIGLAYDPNTDRLYTSGLDGTIRAHLSDGTLIDATFGAGRAIAVAPGFGFGTDLYAADKDTGELVRIDSTGNSTVMGTGFVSVNDLAFGPDGALYASEFDNDRILRIASAHQSVPATTEQGLILTALLLLVVGIVITSTLPSARGSGGA